MLSVPLSALGAAISYFWLTEIPTVAKTVRLLKKNGIKLTFKEKWKILTKSSEKWNFTHELPAKGVVVKFSANTQETMQTIEVKTSVTKEFNTSFYNALTMKNRKSNEPFDFTKYISLECPETPIFRQTRKINNRLGDIYRNNRNYHGYELSLAEGNELSLNFANPEMAVGFEELKRIHRKDFRRRLAVARANQKHEETDQESSLAIEMKRG